MFFHLQWWSIGGGALWLHALCAGSTEHVQSESGIQWPIECVDSFVSVCMKILKMRDDFDLNGQLDSIAPLARSNPTARRRWNHHEFFKIFMNIRTELPTLSMGHSINILLNPQKVLTPSSLSSWRFWKTRDDCDVNEQFYLVAPEARSNPAVRRCRNHLEFFNIVVTKVTRVSTLSVGSSVMQLAMQCSRRYNGFTIGLLHPVCSSLGNVRRKGQQYVKQLLLSVQFN